MFNQMETQNTMYDHRSLLVGWFIGWLASSELTERLSDLKGDFILLGN